MADLLRRRGTSDLGFAARILRRSPGFTLLAVLSLALAIGANSTIFSIAHQLLLARLGVADPGELRVLATDEPRLSYPVYQELAATSDDVLDGLVAFHKTGVNAKVGDGAHRVLLDQVSGNYHRVLGVRQQLGRGIRPADDTAASEPVAVISDAFFETAFARDPDVVGRTMELNDVAVTIVGVDPPEFTGASSTLPAEAPEVLVSLAHATRITPSSSGVDWLNDPESRAVIVVGRLRAGVDERVAEAALDARHRLALEALVPRRPVDGEDGGEGAAAEILPLTLEDGSRGLFQQRETFAKPLTVLMLFLALVLLLACANVATLMLARGARRRSEISLRLALGASPGRVLRQLVVESVLLAVLAGGVGLWLAWLGRHAFTGYTTRFDWQVFAFTAAVTLATGALFGLAPAVSALRASLAGGIRRRSHLGKAVVAFQIALAVLLVSGAGLFVRSLLALTAVDPGFRTDHLLLAQVVLPQNRYPAGANVAFHQRLEAAIAEIPGVRSVAGTVTPYLDGQQVETSVEVLGLASGGTAGAGEDDTELYNSVGNRFFETLGVPIVGGRGFTSADTSTSRRVAVVNQRFAATRFPGRDPVGEHIRLGVYGGYGDLLAQGDIEIVGVCGDTQYRQLGEAPPAQVFVPFVQQEQVRRLTYHVLTRGDPAALVPALRRAVHAADPAVPITDLRTQEEQIDESLVRERLLVSLTSGFGLLALVLASVGIYGLMSYAVAGRTREIGIRMALGAIPRQILTMVLAESLWLSTLAIALGAVATVLATRAIQSLLFGVAASDPAVLLGTVTLLLAVALAAAWRPAWRAARVDPMEALRRDG